MTEERFWEEMTANATAYQPATGLLGLGSLIPESHAMDHAVRLVAAHAVIQALQGQAHHLEGEFFMAEIGRDLREWSHESKKAAAWIAALMQLEKETGTPYMAAARFYARHFVEDMEYVAMDDDFRIVGCDAELAVLRQLSKFFHGR